MQNFLTVLLWISFGSACAYYARAQKRNPYIWFFLGLTFGLLGLLFLVLLPTFKRWSSQSLLKKRRVVEEQKLSATPTLESLIAPTFLEKYWYYLDGERRQLGPMSFAALKKAWQEGKVVEDTYVWNEELSNWKVFKELFPLQKENTRKT